LLGIADRHVGGEKELRGLAGSNGVEKSRVWFLGKCLALYPSTKKRHMGT